MSWSSEVWQRRMEDLIENCTNKVLAEMEEQIMNHLRAESQKVMDVFLERTHSTYFEATKRVGVKEPEVLIENRGDVNLPITHVLYAFGIVILDHFITYDLLGMEDTQCFLICEADLGMVVCQVPVMEYDERSLHLHMEDIPWVEAHARRHEEVILQCMEAGPVIPMPFCTIFTTRDNVEAQLRENKDFLHGQLSLLTNHSEMHIKLYIDPKQLKAKIQEEKPFSGGNSGSNYFLKRQWEKDLDTEMQKIIEGYGEGIYQNLKSLSAGCNLQNKAEISPPDGLQVVFSAQFLLINDRKEEWEEKIIDFDQVADSWGFILDVSGPWPPYHFAGTNEEE